MKHLSTAFILAALLLVQDALAGGPLGAVGTTPRRYPASKFPLVYRTDLGSLGAFNNATATAISVYAFQQWDNVTTAALSFTNAGQLARDVTSPTDPYISGSTQFTDGINPVVFDTDGSITDARLGVGAKNSVLGFASSAYSGANYVEGYAIINGALSGTGSVADQDRYRATITHEIGHFLGLGHSQVALHADFATMYPIIIKTEQQTLDADDVSAISNLYPVSGYSALVGSISGTVKSAGGANLSGVNVLAVNTVTGVAYSGVVDYFSGGKSGFDSPPARTGSYTISGLPPGSYHVRMEPVNANFTGGSSIASYNTPINTTVAREWYNGANESGDMLADNTNQQTSVLVNAGSGSGGINLVANESPTLSTMVYHDGTPAVAFPLPLGSVTQYATRFTAPSNGSLTSIKFLLQGTSSLPQNGTLTITVHANATGSIGGVPGTVLGSVSVPFRDLVADQQNEIWLRGLGSAVNFTAGTNFHVAFSTNGVGTPTFLSDDGSPTQNRSSYFMPGSGWRNFGDGGFNVGYNLLVWGIYSTSGTQAPLPAIAVSASALEFGRVRVGGSTSQSIRVTNTGTAALNVVGMGILGQDSLDFSITTGGGAFSLAAGASRDLTVRFAPLNAGGVENGSKSAHISISSNAEPSPFTISMLGNSVQPFAARFDTIIAFPAAVIGRSTIVDTAIITNTCNDTLHISSVELSGPDAGGAVRLLTSAGAADVAPGNSYRVRLQFTPTERRSYNATLLVRHDDTTGSTEFSVAGRGVMPAMALSATAVNAGRIQVGQDILPDAIVVRNTGDVELRITDLRISGANATDFTIVSPQVTQGSPAIVQVGDSLRVQIRFRPIAGGARTASLEIVAESLPPMQVALSGAGTQGLLVLSSGTIDFGDVPIVSANERLLIAVNTGDAPARISSVLVVGVGFSLVEGPASGTTIAPGDSVRLRIRFAPAVAGLATGAVTIVAEGQVPLVGALTGRGVQPGLGVDRTMISFGLVRPGRAASDSLVLRNTGTVPVTINSIMLNGQNAAAFEFGGIPALPFTLGPDATQVLRLGLKPQTVQGALTAGLVIEGEGGVRTDVGLTAVVGLPLVATVSSVDFGTHQPGGSRDTVITVRNMTAADLTVVDAMLEANGNGTPGNFFQLINPSVPFTIPGNGEVNLGLRFNAAGAAGLYTGRLALRTNDPGDSLVVVTLAGTVSQVGAVNAGTISAGGINISRLLVLPNPVRDRVELLMDVGGTGRLPATISLTNARGEVLAMIHQGLLAGNGTLHEQRFSFDLRGYPSGEYFVTLNGGGESMTAKVVVVR